MFHTMRWKRPTIASALSVLALSVALTSQAVTSQAMAKGKTITAVMHSDLRIIDPLFTTAYITRDHGYMVYDTLLATDSDFKIQPQMADVKVSDDKLTYTFTLRDGLKWHDGAPVTAEDCVASLKRWGRADNMGQKLMDFTASIEPIDAKSFALKLKEPYGLVLEFDRQAVVLHAVHDAQAHGGNAGRPADEGADRIRSVQVRAGRIPAGREGGL